MHQNLFQRVLLDCAEMSVLEFFTHVMKMLIFQVSVHDEGRDMWQVYLDMKEYAAALANCRNSFQRDQIYLVQADAAFSARDLYRAASFYAMINYTLSFKEISLKFIAIGEQAKYILDLQLKLSLLVGKATKDSSAGPSEDSIMRVAPADKLRWQFDEAIANECPFCGDLMIREISLPFILPEELASWEIKPQVTSQKTLPTTI